MKKVSFYMFSFHRVFGTLISVFFFMWFVSGLVLIYHPYPNVTDEQLYEKKETLPSSLPDIQEYIKRIPQPVKQVKVHQFQDQTLISFITADSTYTYCADTLQKEKKITFAFLEQTAKEWIKAPIIQVDTLHTLEQWVLYSRYERALPIYKFYFDDKEKHQLFISGRTGEVQQLTDAEGRFWAWVGAIPHKFYLPFIRKDVDIWKTSVSVGGLFCLLAASTGLYLGIYAVVKRYRHKKKFESPYRKRGYRLHHITGLLFGIFLVTWGISGLVAMQRIPQWMINTHGNYIFNPAKMWGKKPLPIEAYKLDYRKLKETYPDLKEVIWKHFREIPVYFIVAGTHEYLIDASCPSEVKELFIPKKTIVEGIRQIHGKDALFHLSLMEKYDEYYLSRKGTLPLPAYKIVVDDADHSRYYISPKTGYIRYLNKNKMVKKWLFSGFHYLNIQCLLEKPALWTFLIWLLCIGGATVSATGIWLGVQHTKRKTKQLFRKNQP